MAIVIGKEFQKEKKIEQTLIDNMYRMALGSTKFIVNKHRLMYDQLLSFSTIKQENYMYAEKDWLN